MDIANAIAACWPHLNATGAGDAMFWTEAELYAWADEELKRIARAAPVFVETASTALVGGTGRYSLPARHLATVEAVAISQTMRASSIEEFSAGDVAWATRTTAQPRHYAQDENGLDGITLYPVPDGTMAGNLATVYAQYPAAVSAGSSTITAPEVLRDAFMFAALAGARGKETPSAMPEVAEWCAGVTGLYRQTVSEVWG